MRWSLALAALGWAASAAAMGVSGEVGIVSDYRYRGVSLSDDRAALQASLTLEHDSGLYAEIWGSTLGNDWDTEVDLTGGFERDLSDHLSLDLSGTYYVYPTAASDNYVEMTAIAIITKDKVAASLGASYAPAQRGLRDEDGRKADNVYLFAMAEWEAVAPLTLKAGLGYERGAFDEVEHGGKWDWSLGAEVAASPATLGIAYVGSSADLGGRHALVVALSFGW